MIDSILNSLNDEQRRAVLLPSGSALILAGAGSGKTRVLTSRIATLLSSGTVNVRHILAVTFTNKAAKEMMTRLSAMLPFELRALWVGTFHGLSHRLLRLHWREAGLAQNFQIMDMQDQTALIKRVLREMSIDEEKMPAKKVQYWINQQKEKGLRPDQIEVKDYGASQYLPIYQAYELQCAREGSVDFSELLLRSYELLRDHQAIREHYQARFLHVLVDEYQDTNDLQVAWLRQLCGEHTSVFAVGDDDQSIYAFRGANTKNMARFRDDFRAQHLIKLTQNYRSCGYVLKAANALISGNTDRLGKDLWTDQGDGDKITVFEAGTDLQEANCLVERMRELMDEGFSRDEIAVLYRSNAQSRVIEHALFQSGIPYRVYGGLRFFDRAEIKNAMAYLRLIDRDDDDGAFLRVVNFPARGIGSKTLEQLTVAAASMNEKNALPLLATAREVGGKFAPFVALIDDLRMRKHDLTLPQLIELVIHDSGLETQYAGEKDGQDRVDNLHELVAASHIFVEEMRNSTFVTNELGEEQSVLPEQYLTQFLSSAALESGESESVKNERAVHLMTVHASKGLEFRAVFITGLEEGLFPHENSANEPNGLEEERRLMYVAITRAKERLMMSWAGSRQMHGRSQYHLVSRFLDEIPNDYLIKQKGPGVMSREFSSSPRSYQSSAWDDWVGERQRSQQRIEPLLTERDKAFVDRVNESRVVRGGEHGEIEFGVGMRVEHAKFGRGTVRALEGTWDNAKAQIDFDRYGRKWLSLAVAKLELCQ